MELTILLIAVLVALNIADICSTQKVLSLDGYEVNGLVRWVMSKLGVLPGLLAVKAGFLALVAGFLKIAWNDPIVVYCALGLLDAGYAALLVNNILVCKRLNRR